MPCAHVTLAMSRGPVLHLRDKTEKKTGQKADELSLVESSSEECQAGESINTTKARKHYMKYLAIIYIINLYHLLSIFLF